MEPKVLLTKDCVFIQGVGSFMISHDECVNLEAKGLYAVLWTLSSRAAAKKQLSLEEVFDMLCRVLHLALDTEYTLDAFQMLLDKEYIVMQDKYYKEEK